MPLSGVATSDATSATVLTASLFQDLPLLHYATGNGGNDTIYIASSVLGGSSVFGGQGSDSIDAATHPFWFLPDRQPR